MLGLYIVLLALASTRFSILDIVEGTGSLTWDYVTFCDKNGWGYRYVSEYSAKLVLTYVAAFLAGTLGHAMAVKYIAGPLNTLGLLLGAAGLVSFLIEGSHWISNHHLSLIATCPAASLLLALVATVRLDRLNLRLELTMANASEPRA